MIPIGGLDTLTAVQFSERTRDRQIEILAREPLRARQIEAFRERIADIDSPQALVDDPEVFGVVMRAYDLEDQIFGRAMMKRILESDLDDRKSLINRMADPRFRALHKAMAFPPEGGPGPDFADPDWQQKIVDRLLERGYIDQAGAQNEGAGIALEFRSKVDGVSTWFDILKDRDMSRFMRRALGLPDEMVRLDIDRQADLFAAKFDIGDFKDPKVVDGLVKKFSVIYDAVEGRALRNNAALTLMQGAVSVGQGGGFTPILINIPAVIGAGRPAY